PPREAEGVRALHRQLPHVAVATREQAARIGLERMREAGEVAARRGERAPGVAREDAGATHASRVGRGGGPRWGRGLGAYAPSRTSRHGAGRAGRAARVRPPMLAFELAAATKHYGARRPALDAVDLAVPEGTALGLLGPNGAGKTTALRLLLGFARPTRGAARLRGRDPFDPASRIGVGYVPERLGLPAAMTL